MFTIFDEVVSAALAIAASSSPFDPFEAVHFWQFLPSIPFDPFEAAHYDCLFRGSSLAPLL